MHSIVATDGDAGEILWEASESKDLQDKDWGESNGGQGRSRTADASLFRAALYQLSYLATCSRRAGAADPVHAARKTA